MNSSRQFPSGLGARRVYIPDNTIVLDSTVAPVNLNWIAETGISEERN